MICNKFLNAAWMSLLAKALLESNGGRCGPTYENVNIERSSNTECIES